MNGNCQSKSQKGQSHLQGLGGMVDDDLPAFVGFFEDEGEDAVGVAAFFLVAVEEVFADDYDEVVVEGGDLELGKGEGAHGGFGGVVVAVMVEHAVDAAEDLAGD